MGIMVDHPQAYFRQWLPPRSDLLGKLENEALDQEIPIVGPVLGQMLYLLVRLLGPGCRILELGTATGYSAIYLGEGCREKGGRVISLEQNPRLARRARGNIDQAGLAEVIEVRCVDALEALSELKGPLDMIFMDIEKIDYVRALPACRRLLRSNGLLIADNTGFAEADSFNRAIWGDEAWRSVNLWAFLPGHSPENDGFCVALKA